MWTGVDDGTLVVNVEKVHGRASGCICTSRTCGCTWRGQARRSATTNAKDAVEPRWKVAGPGGVFPVLSRADHGGRGGGRIAAWRGGVVLEAAEPVPGEQIHFREQILDMSGPGAEFSPFAQTLNVGALSLHRTLAVRWRQ